MKICPAGCKLFHVDGGWTDRLTRQNKQLFIAILQTNLINMSRNASNNY